MRYKILSAMTMVGLIPTFYGLSSFASAPDNMKFFISEEVKPCITSGGNAKACDINNPADLLVLNTTHNLRNSWVSNSLNNCSEVPTRGDYLDGSTVQFLTPTLEKVIAKVSLRDISATDSENNSIGLPASTQGSLSTTIGTTMQDYSPKSISWVDLPYWSESSGSNVAGNRNAVLFEFYDEAGLPLEVASFGAWFGDLETRSDVLPASITTYDRNGNTTAPKNNIFENVETDLSKCGASTSLGQGCGNQTTRWIGFTDVDNRNVQKVLVTVGEDDLGGDGSREHLSFTGPTIIRNFGCTTTSIPTVSPSVIATPSLATTSTPQPSPTFIPTATPTTLILPTPSSTLTPSPAFIPTATPTAPILISPSASPLPSPTAKPTTTQYPSSTPTPTTKQNGNGTYCCNRKSIKTIISNFINYIVRLFEEYQTGKNRRFWWYR